MTEMMESMRAMGI